MNDQRPTRWPCSADSSRNAGPAPRSLRKAETGVSQSSTNVCRTGTRLCSRASARDLVARRPDAEPQLQVSGDGHASTPSASASARPRLRSRTHRW